MQGLTSPHATQVRGQGQLPELSARLRSTSSPQAPWPSPELLWTRERGTKAERRRERIARRRRLVPPPRACKPALASCTSSHSPRGVHDGHQRSHGTCMANSRMCTCAGVDPAGGTGCSHHATNPLGHKGAAATPVAGALAWASQGGQEEGKSLTIASHSGPQPPPMSARRKEEVSASHPENGTRPEWLSMSFFKQRGFSSASPFLSPRDRVFFLSSSLFFY